MGNNEIIDKIRIYSHKLSIVDYLCLNDDLDILEDNLDVLTTIFKKRINVLLFLDSLIYDGLTYYNSNVPFPNLKLTEEEYIKVKGWVECMMMKEASNS